MKKTSKITAYIQGGLGNQLFIYFAALAQAERLDCAVELDISWYNKSGTRVKQGTPREFLLKPFIDVHNREVYLSTNPVSFSQKVALALKGNLFVEQKESWRHIDNKVHEGTRMVGYFQSANYFEAIAAQVHEHWCALNPSHSERDSLARLAATEFIALHVRRGDYLSTAASGIHGLATSNYFSRALKVTRGIHGHLPAYVFTDSPDIVAEELNGVPDLEILARSDFSEVFTIRAMASARGLVMSNSSFSWWAAYLMSKAPEASIIAPRPWFANGDTPTGLLRPEWLTIGA